MLNDREYNRYTQLVKTIIVLDVLEKVIQIFAKVNEYKKSTLPEWHQCQ